MSTTEMPAAEASERASYELAFHVLPTVAEGEVATVFENIKAELTKIGVEITTEEAPKRFDLAYEIVKYLEGRNRKFSSAYFGWVRFTAEPDQVAAVNEVVEEMSELLRHLVTRLNKSEESFPFYFHEALDVPQVEEVGGDEAVAEEATATEAAETEGEADATSETEASEETAETATEDGEEAK